MFDMFPFLMNSVFGNGYNSNANSSNNINIGNNFNNNPNNNGYGYSSYTSKNTIVGTLGGTFTGIFNEVFTTLIANQDLINNMVDTILNNETMNSILDEIDNINEELDLKLIDYGDRYLIEGKLAGFNKKDMDIDYENDHITIKVKKNQVFSNQNSMVAIFQQGNDLEKSYYVPNVETSKIQAVYNADVLRIYLKKRPAVEKATAVVDVESFIDADNVTDVVDITDIDKIVNVE